MTKNTILDELEKSEIHYRAMKALVKELGLTTSTSETTAEPVEQTKPQSEAEPEPVITEPTIIYKGNTNITLEKGQSETISVLFAGVTSTKEFVVVPNMSSLGYSVSAEKVTNGYREDICVKGTSSGSFKMYIKAKPNDSLVIKVTVRG